MTAKKPKKRTCRFCGRKFETEDAAARYCSPLCLQMGGLVGTRSAATGRARAMHPLVVAEGTEKPERTEKRMVSFPRVDEQFALPLHERWKTIKYGDLTLEEREYAGRRAKRELFDERRMDDVLEWNGEERVSERYKGCGGDRMGDSDDGTV